MNFTETQKYKLDKGPDASSCWGLEVLNSSEDASAGMDWLNFLRFGWWESTRIVKNGTTFWDWLIIIRTWNYFIQEGLLFTYLKFAKKNLKKKQI